MHQYCTPAAHKAIKELRHENFNPHAAEPGFITLCIQLAQATFSDVMPSRPTHGTGDRPGKRAAPRTSKLDGRLNDWFYRQQVKQREAYLAQSTDIFDLERRIRHLERRPYY